MATPDTNLPLMSHRHFCVTIFLNLGSTQIMPYQLKLKGRQHFHKAGKMFLLVSLALLLSVSYVRAQFNFQEPVRLEEYNRPTALIQGDFDGDGLSEIAYLLYSGQICVKYRQPDGTFRNFTSQTPPLMAVFNPFETGDLNKDGKTDLVFISNGVNANINIVVLFSDGASFRKSILNTGINSYSTCVRLTDFNNDGNLDIVFNILNGATIRAYLGDGSGNFSLTSVAFSPSPGLAFMQFITNDFNKDGLKDFAVLTYNDNLVVYSGLPDGGYKFNSYSIGESGGIMISADFTGDSKPEIVMTSGANYNHLIYFVNDGVGGFTKSFIATPFTPFGVDYRDWNLDGKNDILIKFQSSFAVMKNDGGTFSSQTVMTNNFGIGPMIFDLENDGIPELVSITNNRLSIEKKADTIYANFKSLILGPIPAEGLLRDFDKDGNLDLLASNPEVHAVSLHFGDGIGNFKNVSYFDTHSQTATVAAGDFNSDGFDDIVYATLTDYLTYTHSVWLIASDGLKGFKPPVNIGSSTNALAVADVNGDHQLDIVGASTVYLGDGKGNFTTKNFVTPAMGHRLQNITSADLNGDALEEVVFQSYGEVYIGTFTGSGELVFSPVSVPTNISNLRLADFNKDGRPDMVASTVEATSSGLSILINKGDMKFEQQRTIEKNADNMGYGFAADLDSDGLEDIVVDGHYPTGMYFYRQIEGFQFVRSGVVEDTSSSDILIGDLDNDGKPEILRLSANGHPVTLIKWDFVNEPSMTASNLAFTMITEHSVKMSFTKGNGMGRFLLVQEGTTSSVAPGDCVSYSIKSEFGAGQEVSPHCFAIAAGDSSSFVIRNLESSKDYTAMIFEYNLSNEGLQNYSPRAAKATFRIEVVGIKDPPKGSQTIFPNPSEKFLHLHDQPMNDVFIIDTNGTKVNVTPIRAGDEFVIDIQDLAPGLYVLLFSNEQGEFRQRFVKK